MNRPLLFNSKHILILSLSVGISLNTVAQEKTKEISSPKKTIEEPKELDYSEIVTFPIESKSTTDPNYEINKQKSLDTQKTFDLAPHVIVKDDKYYQHQINELKRRIQDIQDNPNSPNVNTDKISGLTDKLSDLEQEYIAYTKSK
tara:strand:+ start:699 stop:1133 length:435 start_codon:yes stop_codon:yes gene_type:complete